MILEIQTKDGSIVVESLEVRSVSCGQDDYSSGAVPYLEFSVLGGFSMGRHTMLSKEAAKEAVNLIKEHMPKREMSATEQEAVDRADYIKGFKDGCEYALKLNRVEISGGATNEA